MKSFGLARLLLVGAALIAVIGQAKAQSAPAEKPSVVLNRTAGSSLQLQESLSQNHFRTETVKVPYTVQVPYQDTETYEEQVPYEVSVPYQDTETYYENEYQCHDETSYERVCARHPRCHTETDFRRECSNETTCSPGSSPTRQCNVEHICRTGRDGQPVCIDKEVCREVGGGAPECRTQPVCRNVPYERQVCNDEERCENVPRIHQRCGYENVAKTRVVTKYRTETRYRSETRTRTVTRYRTEKRCCRDVAQQVFDHQQQVQVELNFANDSVLLNNETESFDLVLTGSEANPSIALSARATVFDYEVRNIQASAGVVRAEVRRLPKFKAADLAQGSISGMALAEKSVGVHVLTFIDKGVQPRVASLYALTISDAQGKVLLSQQAAALQGAAVEIALQAQLPKDTVLTVDLNVARQGLNLDQPVAFRETAQLKLDDIAALSAADKIAAIQVNGTLAKAVLQFADLTPDRDDVMTAYKVTISRTSTVASGFKALGSKALKRAGLVVDADGKFNIPLNALGVTKANLVAYAKPGKRLKIDIQVVRQSSRLPAPAKFMQSKVVELK